MSEVNRYEGYRCLIVEDNIHAAELMALFFRRNNILSDIAEDGKVGLDFYLADPIGYAVIFLDLQMPVMDGYTMAKAVRASNTATALSIPIVAMSGTNTGDISRNGGFNLFLKKPFELLSLINVLDEVLSK